MKTKLFAKLSIVVLFAMVISACNFPFQLVAKPVEKEAADVDDPVLPDMPGTDLHTAWAGDISFIGWKGQVAFPNSSQEEMVKSQHVYSLHRIDAENKEMTFLVTWAEDIQNVTDAWIVNEYDIVNFDWDVNHPDEFYDRFVSEIEDWTGPNAIGSDTTIPAGTKINVSVFLGTNTSKPYAMFDYTKP